MIEDQCSKGTGISINNKGIAAYYKNKTIQNKQLQSL